MELHTVFNADFSYLGSNTNKEITDNRNKTQKAETKPYIKNNLCFPNISERKLSILHLAEFSIYLGFTDLIFYYHCGT